jgi:hypothetical protein
VEAEQRQYTSFLRAQLTRHELFFLFYNGLSSFGKGFKPLIEDFTLLEHFDTKMLLEGETKKRFDERSFS